MTDAADPDIQADPWATWDADRQTRPTASERATRFAFYARVSTEDNQDPETSRQWQRRAAENLLRLSAPGAAIVAEYFDLGQSRSLPWSRRREASRLLTELDNPGRSWDAVVVGEGQRCFYGSQFTDTAPIFEDRGVGLYVPELGGPYDPRNPSHYTLMSVTGGLSRGERQRIQERVRLSMGVQVAEQGRYQGGRPPYGYVAVSFADHPNPHKASQGMKLKRLEPDPVAAPVVRRIFAEVLAGQTLRQICSALNAEGIACPSAHDPTRNRHRSRDGWQPTTILSILANERYTGFEQWGKFKKQERLTDPDNPSRGNETRLVRNDAPPTRSLRPAHEALVSVEDWQAAQLTLRARSAGGRQNQARLERPARTAPRPTALRGVLRCVYCAHKLQGEITAATTKRSVRYRCRRRDLVEGSVLWETHPPAVVVNESQILGPLTDWVKVLFMPAHRNETLEALMSSFEDPKRGMSHAEVRLKEARSRLERLVAALEAGIEMRTLAPRIKAAQEEVDTLESLVPRDVTAERFPTRDEVGLLVDETAANFGDLFGTESDPGEVNAFLRSIELQAVVDPVAKTATVTADLTPLLARETLGVSVRVRGGT